MSSFRSEKKSVVEEVQKGRSTSKYTSTTMQSVSTSSDTFSTFSVSLPFVDLPAIPLVFTNPTGSKMAPQCPALR